MNLMILALLDGAQSMAVFQVVVMLLLALILGVLLGMWLRGKNNGVSELREEFEKFKKKVSKDQAAQDDSIKSVNNFFVTIESALKVEKEVSLKQGESIKSFKSSLTIIESGLSTEKNVNSEQNVKIEALSSGATGNVDLSSLERSIGALKTNQEENNRLFSDAADAIKELDREKDVIDSSGKGLQAEIVLLKSENQKLWDAINVGTSKGNTEAVLVVSKVVGANDKERAALESVAAKKHLINFSSIGEATESDKDDLKVIKGVGPFIEKKLNALDIWTFAQIASFDKEDVDSVTDAIEFFPGRIVRDNWVSQAKDLK